MLTYASILMNNCMKDNNKHSIFTVNNGLENKHSEAKRN